MDVYMMRNGMPQMSAEADAPADSMINEVKFDLHCAYEDSISMDGSVILDSVITNLTANAYNSVAIDIKRDNGTIGYRSALATVDAYSAAAFEATDLHNSVMKLSEQDILTVGVVYSYLDNLVPRQDRSVALLDGNGLPYEDSRGNTYLNPNSETVYKYIKDIIAEAAEMGVSVFVLRGTEIPENAGSGFSDGFETLSARLYEDIGTYIKLLEGVEVDIDDSLVQAVAGEDQERESTENEEENSTQENGSTEETSAAQTAGDRILNLFDEDLGNSRIYLVSVSGNAPQIKTVLEEGGVESFILRQSD